MPKLEADVFHEAVEAWLHHCELRMIAPQQPSLAESEIDDVGIVILRNEHGFLARYSTQRKRITTNL
jgi:hypothetical protein